MNLKPLDVLYPRPAPRPWFGSGRRSASGSRFCYHQALSRSRLSTRMMALLLLAPAVARRLFRTVSSHSTPGDSSGLPLFHSGQDLSSYLDGLLYQRYLTYWDYIHLDTLLSLQVPRTHFPDEEIFIMYHQITELYFKLILHEQRQIVDDKSQDLEIFTEKVTRINNYYKALISSLLN